MATWTATKSGTPSLTGPSAATGRFGVSPAHEVADGSVTLGGHHFYVTCVSVPESLRASNFIDRLGSLAS